MADNTILNPGAGGNTIADEDIGGIHFSKVKLVVGAHGVDGGPVDATNPLPVAGTVTSVPPVRRTLYDMVSATVNYIGYARIAGTSADPIWWIKRLTFSAIGDLEEIAWSPIDSVWDDRAILTYS